MYNSERRSLIHQSTVNKVFPANNRTRIEPISSRRTIDRGLDTGRLNLCLITVEQPLFPDSFGVDPNQSNFGRAMYPPREKRHSYAPIEIHAAVVHFVPPLSVF
jgi:hypothetical protein